MSTFDDTESPVAQDEQPAEAQNEAPVQPAPEVEAAAPAAQTIPLARFNEVYAETQEARRRNKELEAQIAALIQVAQSPRPMPAQEPTFELEPEFKQRADLAMAPYIQQQQALAARLEAMVAAQEFQKAAAGYEPDVVAQAQALYTNWQQTGKKGFVPDDALVLALGMKVRQGVINAQQQQQTAAQQAANFNQAGKTVSRAPAATVPAPKAKPNYNAMSPAQRLEALEADMDDFPI